MTYSTDVILKSAELAKIHSSEARYLISLLDEAQYLVNRQPHNEPYEPTTIDYLFRDVCRVTGCDPAHLRTKNRSRQVSYARHAFSVLAHELFPGVILDRIAALMGLRHDMVIYYFAEVQGVKEKNDFYQNVKLKLNIQ